MTQVTDKSMDAIVALCRRRGFIFQSSEIYGGINGFWDYGPLGAALKRNLKNAWWEDVVERELPGPDGKPVSIVGLESTIIMNPKVWEASGAQTLILARFEKIPTPKPIVFVRLSKRPTGKCVLL